MLSEQQIKVPVLDNGILCKSFCRYMEDIGNRPEFSPSGIFDECALYPD